MALEADEFLAEAKRAGRRKRCGVARVYDTLDEQDRLVFTRMLGADPGDVSAGAIAAVLERHGYEISQNWVSTHRRHKCSCYKP